ncbi:MAG TPA: aminotransferase class IV [Chitinophagaceae bacterium]|nr:aminotransferase class IV [Chitinophagaceae bacterium]
MPGSFIHNGRFHQENDPVISADNRSFRYGDGLFETIRLHNNALPLWHFHEQRLFSGMQALGFDIPKLFTADYLLQQIQALVKKNGLAYARIRITVYRGEGGLTDKTHQTPGFIIQSWPVPAESLSLNINGLRIGIYEDARKSADKFSSIKSNNFLPYVQGALYAREKKWNDALVLNSYGRIADSTIANIYWVKEGKIFTPPLSEGPINGVMRRHLLENALIFEQPLAPDELLQAEEVFLTNAFRGIQWVSFVGEKPMLSNASSVHLFREYISPLFS